MLSTLLEEQQVWRIQAAPHHQGLNYIKRLNAKSAAHTHKHCDTHYDQTELPIMQQPRLWTQYSVNIKRIQHLFFSAQLPENTQNVRKHGSGILEYANWLKNLRLQLASICQQYLRRLKLQQYGITIHS